MQHLPNAYEDNRLTNSAHSLSCNCGIVKHLHYRFLKHSNNEHWRERRHNPRAKRPASRRRSQTRRRNSCGFTRRCTFRLREPLASLNATCVHPLADRTSTQVFATAFAIASLSERKKITYSDIALRAVFSPNAMETTGNVGSQLSHLLCTLAELCNGLQSDINFARALHFENVICVLEAHELTSSEEQLSLFHDTCLTSPSCPKFCKSTDRDSQTTLRFPVFGL